MAFAGRSHHYTFFLLQVLLVLTIFGISSGANLTLELDLDTLTGAYTVDFVGHWKLQGWRTGFHAMDQWWMSSYDDSESVAPDSSLLALQASQKSHGQDLIGPFEKTELKWLNGAGIPFETSFLKYTSHSDILVFEQRWPAGTNATNTTSKVQAGVLSAFPTFSGFTGELSKLHFAALSSDGQLHIARGGPGLAGFEDERGFGGGAPLVLFDDTLLGAVAFAPLTNLGDGRLTEQFGNGHLICGVQEAVQTLEANATQRFLAVAATGPNKALEKLGAILRSFFDKLEPPRSVVTDFLGYWTDNGGFYYHNTQSLDVVPKGPCYSSNETVKVACLTYEATLLNVKAYAEQEGLPYRYLQLDDYFYPCARPSTCRMDYSGEDAGQVAWDAMPSLFPSGLESFQKKLGWPIVAHARWWSGGDDIPPRPGTFKWWTEDRPPQPPLPSSMGQGRVAYPEDPYAFFSFLLGQASTWGLTMFEQDWMSRPLLSQNLTGKLGGVSQYFRKMGQAAAEHNMTILMGSGYAHEVLMSIEVPQISVVFAGQNPIPKNGVKSWKIGGTSSFLRHLGILPFKDNVWSTSYSGLDLPAWPVPYGLWTDNELHLIVAVLSGGPVGIADKIGATDVRTVLAACRSDGLLLRPDMPAGSMDISLLRNFTGELTHTFVDHGLSAGRWHWILNAGLGQSVTLRSVDLDVSQGTVLIGRDYRAGPTASLQLLTSKSLLKLEAACHGWNANLDSPRNKSHCIGAQPMSEWPRQRSHENSARFGTDVVVPQTETVEFNLTVFAPVWKLDLLSNSDHQHHAVHSLAATYWALLGELNKIIGVSKQRLVNVSVSTSCFRAEVLGGHRELVTFEVVTDTPPSAFSASSHPIQSALNNWVLLRVTCELGPLGRAKLMCGSAQSSTSVGCQCEVEQGMDEQSVTEESFNATSLWV